MRHSLTIPEKPQLLYLLAVVDIIALIAIYGVYSNSWIGNNGTPIELPKVSSPLTIQGKSISLQVKGSGRILLGKKLISQEDLSQELKYAKEVKKMENILLLVDLNVPVQLERKYIAEIQQANLKCILISQDEKN